ncbi:extracellular solute-binding protein, partial [Mesorhizobium sp. M4A.F.Ca.ET.050.02.1.1]|uniref:ABC transporter substrate-binding protein n=1 Tax=Mesorhizobium sp. M4A.F.Ca.ET.050.02.1.1 TaxID=2496754 RepID=UPI000FCA6FE0
VRSGTVQWDALSSIPASDLQRLAKQGVIQKIDASAIPGLEKLPRAALSDYGVPALNAVVTVSYREFQGVNPLKSVADFFDPNIKGPRAVSSLAGEAPFNCIVALLSEGVHPDELVKHIDVARCLKVFDKIKDQITAYWSNGSEMAQLMIDNNVDYCICRDGRIVQAAMVNPEWTIQYKGGIQFMGYLSFVKGTKNVDVLNAFATSMLDPIRQAIFSQESGYSAPNPESVNYLPDNLKPFVSVTPAAQAALAALPAEIAETVATQQTEIGKAWQAYVSK